MIVLLLACVSAAAAVLGAPLLALVAGFVAVVLLIDYAFPVTGFLRADSQHAFQRLVWQRRRETLRQRDAGVASSYCPVGSRRRHVVVIWVYSQFRLTRSSEPSSRKRLSRLTTPFDHLAGRAVAGS